MTTTSHTSSVHEIIFENPITCEGIATALDATRRDTDDTIAWLTD